MKSCVIENNDVHKMYFFISHWFYYSHLLSQIIALFSSVPMNKIGDRIVNPYVQKLKLGPDSQNDDLRSKPIFGYWNGTYDDMKKLRPDDLGIIKKYNRPHNVTEIRCDRFSLSYFRVDTKYVVIFFWLQWLVMHFKD